MTKRHHHDQDDGPPLATRRINCPTCKGEPISYLILYGINCHDCLGSGTIEITEAEPGAFASWERAQCCLFPDDARQDPDGR